jgi:hypothetical protein
LRGSGPIATAAIFLAQRVLCLDADHMGTAELIDPAGFAAGNELIVPLGVSEYGVHGLCPQNNKRSVTGYFSGIVRTAPSSATNVDRRLAGPVVLALLLKCRLRPSTYCRIESSDAEFCRRPVQEKSSLHEHELAKENIGAPWPRRIQ